MSRHYRERPSEVLGIEGDPYTAFCLDEACAYIFGQMSGQNPQSPQFAETKEESLVDFLKSFEAERGMHHGH